MLEAPKSARVLSLDPTRLGTRVPGVKTESLNPHTGCSEQRAPGAIVAPTESRVRNTL